MLLMFNINEYTSQVFDHTNIINNITLCVYKLNDVTNKSLNSKNDPSFFLTSDFHFCNHLSFIYVTQIFFLLCFQFKRT